MKSKVKTRIQRNIVPKCITNKKNLFDDEKEPLTGLAKWVRDEIVSFPFGKKKPAKFSFYTSRAKRGYQGETVGKNDVEAGTSSQQYGKQQAAEGGVENMADKENISNKDYTDQNVQAEQKHGDTDQKDKNKAPELISSQESDDSICFEELLSPGGKHWNFGSFQQDDIRNIYRMQLNETNSMVVNEYGTNLVKSKHDPLMVIEARTATSKGEQVAERFQCESLQEEIDNEEGGTQEAPGMEILSQEENPLNQKAQEVGTGLGEVLLKDKSPMPAKENLLLNSTEKVLYSTIPGKETQQEEGIEVPTSQSLSPNWDSLAEEESVETYFQRENQDKENVEKPT
jgi:hypothetical protein